MDFFERLVSTLEYQGKNQKELALYLQCTASTVNSWIKRKSMPAADTALRVSNFLNVSLEYLLTGKERTPELRNEEEKEIIQKFRAISDHDKNMVKTVLDTAYLHSLQGNKNARETL